ncbi:MAG: hypothetical protein IKD18_04190 [Clostridia bacterium]|nr:hypothetical protein [Clostridia bacterium]
MLNKDVFKPIPATFHKRLLESIEKAKVSKASPYRRVFPKVAMAFGVLLVMLPALLFLGKGKPAASETEQGAPFTPEESTPALPQIPPSEKDLGPEYVNLIFSAPEGYTAKESVTCEFVEESENSRWFSITLQRPTDKSDPPKTDVPGSKAVTVNGREAAILFGQEQGDTTYALVYFDTVNVYFVASFSPDFAEEEILSVLEKAEVTEGTEEEHFPYGTFCTETGYVGK